MPAYLPPIVEFQADTPLKKVNWKKIMPTKIPETSVWVNIDAGAIRDSVKWFEGLRENFSSDVRTRVKVPVQGTSDADRQPHKRVRQLKVLDTKTAQNLMILFGSIKMSPKDLARHILTMNEEYLSDAVLQQLIKYWPQTIELMQLEHHRKEIDELHEAEQAALTLGSIRQLESRLKAISFKIKFNELVQDIRPHLESATAACEEIRQAASFAKVLQLILLMGNYMNSDSKILQNAYAFDISFLPKLSNIKSADSKMTLLHFLLQVIEDRHPECLCFPQEMQHLDDASRVSPEQLAKNLTQMQDSIRALEQDLQAFQPHNEQDRFGSSMSRFVVQAREQHETLQCMFSMMERLYTSIAEYFAFEPKKYAMDEFFADIKIFKDQFLESHREIKRIREEKERLEKAKIAREAAERERLRRKKENTINQTKNPFIDLDASVMRDGSGGSGGSSGGGGGSRPQSLELGSDLDASLFEFLRASNEGSEGNLFGSSFRRSGRRSSRWKADSRESANATATVTTDFESRDRERNGCCSDSMAAEQRGSLSRRRRDGLSVSNGITIDDSIDVPVVVGAKSGSAIRQIQEFSRHTPLRRSFRSHSGTRRLVLPAATNTVATDVADEAATWSPAERPSQEAALPCPASPVLPLEEGRSSSSPPPASSSSGCSSSSPAKTAAPAARAWRSRLPVRTNNLTSLPLSSKVSRSQH